MKRPNLARSGFVAVSLITLSACSQSAPPADSASTQPVAPVETTPVAPPMAGGMTKALTKEEVGATFIQQGAPVLVKEGASIRFVVTLTNSGTVSISSQGAFPVNIGVELLASDGKVVKRDFVRARIPEIAAGASADVTVEVPAKDVVGNSIRLELVQEKVAWFSSFGVAPFDFGPFTSCDANGVATVCGADGKPLAAG